MSVLQEISSERIILRVTEANRPAENATVNVTTIRGDDELNGRYETNEDGKIIFDKQKTEDISGVLHLRIDVKTEDNENVFFISITVIRTPDLSEDDSVAIGQRISSVLQESVASTQGSISGNIYVNSLERYERNVTRISLLSNHATKLIDSLRSNTQELKTLQLRWKTGEIDLVDYFENSLGKSVKVSRFRQDLLVTLDRLKDFSDEELRSRNVSPLDLEILYRDLINNNRLTYERGILIEENREDENE